MPAARMGSTTSTRPCKLGAPKIDRGLARISPRVILPVVLATELGSTKARLSTASLAIFEALPIFAVPLVTLTVSNPKLPLAVTPASNLKFRDALLSAPGMMKKR